MTAYTTDRYLDELRDRMHDFHLSKEERDKAMRERRAILIDRTGRTQSDGTWMPYTQNL